MGKKNVSAIEKGAGFFEGFVAGLMDVVRERRVPFEVIYRLATPSGRATICRIVTVAHEDWLSEQPVISAEGALPPNHYRVPITYAPMPSFADLKKEFGENNVSVIFDGRLFELDRSCVGMDRTPGERIFYVHDVGRGWEIEERIAWGLAQRTAVAPNGYRPATHKEEYEFQKAHPELLNLVAPGSSAMDGDGRGVAVLWSDDGQRFLGHDRFDGGCDAEDRVLFVRK